MKSVRLQPIDTVVAIKTEDSVLDALLVEQLDVLRACGGKGLCATCHVYVEEGGDKLAPRTKREDRTLGNLTSCGDSSRLACQARVLGDGVVIRLPEGMYIERAEDLLDLVGKRTKKDVLHPVSGATLVKKGKIITRSRVEELKSINDEVQSLKDQS